MHPTPSIGSTASVPALVAEVQTRRPVRLAYLVSHPIQYQSPLLRRIAQEPTTSI